MFKAMRRNRGERHRDAGGAMEDWAGPDPGERDRHPGSRMRWGWGRRGARCAAASDAHEAPTPVDGPECGQGRGHGRGLGLGHGRGRHHQPPFEGRSLNDITPGQTCRIFALHGRGPIRQRLMDMGLVPNADVTVVRAAPLNDPIEVRVGATLVSVRRAEAARIEVVHA